MRHHRKLMLFTVSKDEWNTTEDTGKSHCTYCGMSKGTFWAEATSNSEKIKPVALAIIELCFTEGISQSGSQSEDNSIKYKFRGNF